MRDPKDDPRRISGGRAPLFERLVDEERGQRDGDRGDEEEEPRPLRVYDVAAVKESVRRELERLLGTRRATPPRAEGPWGPTVLDYGVPDFSSYSALSGDDQHRLASDVERAVAAFEPRLSGVRVRVERVRADDRALVLRLEARLRVGSETEAVSFPLLVRNKAGEAEVSEGEPE